MALPIKNKVVRRFLFQVVGATVLAGLGLVAWTHAQDTKSRDRIYVVCHVDVAPGTSAATGSKLLQQYVADSRKDKGAVRVEAYVQIDRNNHFSLVEVWQDRQAFEAHENAAHTKQFRQEIQPLLGSPFDERLHQLLE
jgi:quinol monooxygenase YgiN